MKLEELLDICINKKRCISFVGAGGKTSLIYLIAKRAAKSGKKVVVSTTTHIIKPENHYCKDYNEVNKIWQQGYYAVIGDTDSNDSDKLVAPPKKLFKRLISEADLVLIESDGSKQYPCKVPLEYEPVILPESDFVIGVMGMSALGRRVKDCCFRYEKAQFINSLDEKRIFDEDLAVEILSSEWGTKKSVNSRDYIAVLNQCDDEALHNRGKKIADMLNKKYNIKAVCCSLKVEKEING